MEQAGGASAERHFLSRLASQHLARPCLPAGTGERVRQYSVLVQGRDESEYPLFETGLGWEPLFSLSPLRAAVPPPCVMVLNGVGLADGFVATRLRCVGGGR